MLCIFVSFETNTPQYLLIPRKHRGARFRGYFRFLVPFSAQLFCFNRARFAEKISKNIFSCTSTNIFSMRIHHACSTFLKQRTHMFALHNSRIVSGRQHAAPDDAKLSRLSRGQAMKMPQACFWCERDQLSTRRTASASWFFQAKN